MNTTVQSLHDTVDYTPSQTGEAEQSLPHDDATTADALATKVFVATMAYVVIFVVAAVLLVF
jgi:hypothetical protein